MQKEGARSDGLGFLLSSGGRIPEKDGFHTATMGREPCSSGSARDSGEMHHVSLPPSVTEWP